jgi:hypothetical protein
LVELAIAARGGEEGGMRVWRGDPAIVAVDQATLTI